MGRFVYARDDKKRKEKIARSDYCRLEEDKANGLVYTVGVSVSSFVKYNREIRVFIFHDYTDFREMRRYRSHCFSSPFKGKNILPFVKKKITKEDFTVTSKFYNANHLTIVFIFVLGRQAE